MEYSIYSTNFTMLTCVLFSTRQFDHKSFSASFKLGEQRQRRLKRIISIRNIINLIEPYNRIHVKLHNTCLGPADDNIVDYAVRMRVAYRAHALSKSMLLRMCNFTLRMRERITYMCAHAYCNLHVCVRTTNLDYNKMFVTSCENAHHVHAQCTGNLVDILVHSVISLELNQQ